MGEFELPWFKFDASGHITDEPVSLLSLAQQGALRRLRTVGVSIVEGASPDSIRAIPTTRDPVILRGLSSAIDRRIQGGPIEKDDSMQRAVRLVRCPETREARRKRDIDGS